MRDYIEQGIGKMLIVAAAVAGVFWLGNFIVADQQRLYGVAAAVCIIGIALSVRWWFFSANRSSSRADEDDQQLRAAG